MATRFMHGGNVYRKGAPRSGWKDFSANINPFGLSARVREAIASSVDEIVHYPDPSGTELRAALSAFYHVPEECFVLGNGAAELFYVLFHAERPKRVLLPVPSFSEYERATLSAGAEAVYLPLHEENDFVLDVSNVVSDGVDCILIGNPNNPTGNLLLKEDIARLLRKAKKTGTLVAVDESFLDFREDGDLYSARDLIFEYDNLIVLSSLTKFYALPGLRLGFAVTNPKRAARLDMGKDPWNVNLLAQKAGVAALGDKDYQEKSRKLLAQERLRFYRELSSVEGFAVFMPTVNFILIRLKKPWGRSENFCRRMREKGFLVRDCSNYPGLDDAFVRIAVRTPAENKEFMEALFALLSEA